jgi:hypothetical protein
MTLRTSPLLRLSCLTALAVCLAGAEATARAAEHPLVLFSQSDLPALRDKIQSEPCATWWSTTKSVADQALAVTFSDPTLSEYDKSMQASCLAFAYLMTEDTQYRDKGVEALVNVGNGSFDGLVFNWHAGVIETNYALAYDWLFNELSPTELATVQNKTRGLGDMGQMAIAVLRDTPIDATWYSGDYWTGQGSTHGNQRLLPESGLGLLGIAMDDYDDPVRGAAADWRAFVHEHYFGASYPDLYSPYLEKMTPGGIYNEGFSYHVDASHALYPFLLAELRSGAIAIDQVDALIHSWVSLAMPNARAPVFEDSLMARAPAELAAFASFSPNAAEYLWLWNKAQPSASYAKPWLPIIFFDPAVAGTAAEPTFTTRFFDGSYVVFRSDWSEDATYMLILSQDQPRRLHLQPCQSSFQIYAKGAYLAIDPGYGHTNGNAIQSGKAHNLIGVDDIGTSRYDSVPEVAGSYTDAPDPAHLRAHFTTSFLDYADVEVHYDTYVAADQEVPLGVAVSRNFLFPEKRYFVIADEVSSTDVHAYQWYLHFGFETEGTLEVAGPTARWQTQSADGQPVELAAHFISPEVQITSGTSPTEIYEVDTDPAHVWLQAEATASDVDYLTVLFPRLLSEPAPQVEALTDVVGGKGVRVDTARVLMRDRANATTSSVASGVTTDARLSLASEAADTLGYFMAKGVTTFSYRGNEILGSTAALPAVGLEIGATAIVGSLEAPSDGAEVTLRYPGVVAVTSDGAVVTLVDHGEGFIVFPWTGQHELRAELATAGEDAGAGGGARGDGASPSDDGGCGCRAPGRVSDRASPLGLLALVAIVRRRRSR